LTIEAIRAAGTPCPENIGHKYASMLIIDEEEVVKVARDRGHRQVTHSDAEAG
jgi:hypothetical protein